MSTFVLMLHVVVTQYGYGVTATTTLREFEGRAACVQAGEAYSRKINETGPLTSRVYVIWECAPRSSNGNPGVPTGK